MYSKPILYAWCDNNITHSNILIIGHTILCMHCIYINLYRLLDWICTDRPSHIRLRTNMLQICAVFFSSAPHKENIRRKFTHIKYECHQHHIQSTHTTTQEFTIRASSTCVRKYFNSFLLPYPALIVWGGCFCGHRIISTYIRHNWGHLKVDKYTNLMHGENGKIRPFLKGGNFVWIAADRVAQKVKQQYSIYLFKSYDVCAWCSCKKVKKKLFSQIFFECYTDFFFKLHVFLISLQNTDSNI